MTLVYAFFTTIAELTSIESHTEILSEITRANCLFHEIITAKCLVDLLCFFQLVDAATPNTNTRFEQETPSLQQEIFGPS